MWDDNSAASPKVNGAFRVSYAPVGKLDVVANRGEHDDETFQDDEASWQFFLAVFRNV